MLVSCRSPLGLYDLQLIIFDLAKAWQILGVTLVIEQLEVVELYI